MKQINLSLAVVAAILILTAARPYQGHDNPEKLKTVLTNFFDGISTQDFDKRKTATTNDFILYEDGSLWNIDSAFMNIRRHMPFSVKYQMNNFKFFVDNESGDVTYTNHADFTFNTGKKSLDWIESATFRKVNGVWKINFLGATARK